MLQTMLLYWPRTYQNQKWKYYTVGRANAYFDKNMLLVKNPQYLPDHYETLTQYGTHEYLIVSKFRNDRVNIVDFLIKAYFCQSAH